MTVSQLDEARALWLTEKNLYKKYGKALYKRLNEIFSKAEIPVSVSFRTKADDSLLKKMLTKNKPYDEVNDKVGVRVIVHFLSDLNQSDNLINEAFGRRITKRESKMELSDDKTFGYLSIHYDIKSRYKRNPIVAELQLRTICQNTWSELAHILTYKSDIDIPNEVKREINALSALMEIADSQFQMILNMINNLPVSNPLRILRSLHSYFYTNIAAWYDTEMSHHFLSEISDLYEPDENIIQILKDYLTINGRDISIVAASRQDILFFSQPEIVVILERLDNKKFSLIHYWEYKYPIEELENIANAWGTSLV